MVPRSPCSPWSGLTGPSLAACLGRRAKIVEGRLQKARDSMAVVNQASLRDPTKKVSEIIKENIAAIGENIQVSTG